MIRNEVVPITYALSYLAVELRQIRGWLGWQGTVQGAVASWRWERSTDAIRQIMSESYYWVSALKLKHTSYSYTYTISIVCSTVEKEQHLLSLS